jgi:hypothetical protein
MRMIVLPERWDEDDSANVYLKGGMRMTVLPERRDEDDSAT